MTSAVISVLGFSGAILTLYAFFRVSHGEWKAKSKQFQLCNALAAALLILYSSYTHAYANVLLNVAWLIIAATALRRYTKK